MLWSLTLIIVALNHYGESQRDLLLRQSQIKQSELTATITDININLKMEERKQLGKAIISISIEENWKQHLQNQTNYFEQWIQVKVFRTSFCFCQRAVTWIHCWKHLHRTIIKTIWNWLTFKTTKSSLFWKYKPKTKNIDISK